MAVIKVKAGKATVEVSSAVVEDPRFTRYLATMSDSRKSDEQQMVALNRLIEFLFGDDGTDIIMEELAAENKGQLSFEIFFEWLDTEFFSKLENGVAHN